MAPAAVAKADNNPENLRKRGSTSHRGPSGSDASATTSPPAAGVWGAASTAAAAAAVRAPVATKPEGKGNNKPSAAVSKDDGKRSGATIMSPYAASAHFPIMIHKMIEQESQERPDIVHWAEDGSSFVIQDADDTRDHYREMVFSRQPGLSAPSAQRVRVEEARQGTAQRPLAPPQLCARLHVRTDAGHQMRQARLEKPWPHQQSRLNHHPTQQEGGREEGTALLGSESAHEGAGTAAGRFPRGDRHNARSSRPDRHGAGPAQQCQPIVQTVYGSGVKTVSGGAIVTAAAAAAVPFASPFMMPTMTKPEADSKPTPGGGNVLPPLAAPALDTLADCAANFSPLLDVADLHSVCGDSAAPGEQTLVASPTAAVSKSS